MKRLTIILLAVLLQTLGTARAGDGIQEAISNTPVLIAAGKYALTGWNTTGLATGPTYLHFYDAASTGAVTVGTTPQVYEISVPQTGATIEYPGPVHTFQNGIVVAATTSPLSSGSTAPSTALLVQLQWTQQ
jgi:hypothetical protein